MKCTPGVKLYNCTKHIQNKNCDFHFVHCVVCCVFRLDFTCDSSQSTSLAAGTTDLKVFRW